jgi:hypothetical protein
MRRSSAEKSWMACRRQNNHLAKITVHTCQATAEATTSTLCFGTTGICASYALGTHLGNCKLYEFSDNAGVIALFCPLPHGHVGGIACHGR